MFATCAPGIFISLPAKRFPTSSKDQGSVQFANPNSESDSNCHGLASVSCKSNTPIYHHVLAKNPTHERLGESKLGFGFIVWIDKSKTAQIETLPRFKIRSGPRREISRNPTAFRCPDPNQCWDQLESGKQTYGGV